jgi:hypothetical protein
MSGLLLIPLWRSAKFWTFAFPDGRHLACSSYGRCFAWRFFVVISNFFGFGFGFSSRTASGTCAVACFNGSFGGRYLCHSGHGASPTASLPFFSSSSLFCYQGTLA